MRKPIQSISDYAKKRMEIIHLPADIYTGKLQKKVQGIIDQGYYQVSRRFRTLARLPKGKTGMEALLEATDELQPMDAVKWVKGLGEGHAGDHFLRCHAGKNVQIILTEEEFHMFRKLGGGCYHTKYYDNIRSENEPDGGNLSVQMRIRKRLNACE